MNDLARTCWQLMLVGAVLCLPETSCAADPKPAIRLEMTRRLDALIDTPSGSGG